MKDSVIIVSGGMDSITLLYDKKDEIALGISFDYGSNHNAKEIPYAKKHCERLGIKHIRGYFFQAKNMSEEAEIRNSSLRMLLLTNIALVRMHTLEPLIQVSAEPSDSVKSDSLPKMAKEPKTMDMKLKATPVPRELKVVK